MRPLAVAYDFLCLPAVDPLAPLRFPFMMSMCFLCVLLMFILCPLGSPMISLCLLDVYLMPPWGPPNHFHTLSLRFVHVYRMPPLGPLLISICFLNVYPMPPEGPPQDFLLFSTCLSYTPPRGPLMISLCGPGPEIPGIMNPKVPLNGKCHKAQRATAPQRSLEREVPQSPKSHSAPAIP